MEILDNQLQNNAVGHAYLFIGPKGSGKLKEASDFASKIASQFDIQTYSPEGARGYLAEQIKEIVRSSNLTPIQGDKKVYIIKNAESLGTSGANAFLKTLEEPPDFDVFILLANNLDNVLPTIVSRCQVIKFKQLPTREAIKFVQKESGSDYASAKNAVELYGGDTDSAITLLLNQDMQDFCDEINYTIGQDLNEWEILEKSKDIVSKLKEICDGYKHELEDKAKELDDIVDLSKQNKRAVTAKQTEVMHLFCAVVKQHLMSKVVNNPKYVKSLHAVEQYEAKLAYNISPQNFFDCVLLKVKEL
ncbi:MAG: hypothetical protein Q4E88_01485 [Coriobacteriia bacterium]|nr:hypothetical protein [Coriobacteriia bacterium]